METLKKLRRIRSITILFVIFSLVGCNSMSLFDQHAYTQTTSVKVDALNLMDLAVEEYTTHETSVVELQTQLQKIYEYEKNRPKNEFTLKMWDKLLAEDGHLLGGFLNRWKNETKLNEIFIVESKKQVAQAFDYIAGFESEKLKEADIPNF